MKNTNNSPNNKTKSSEEELVLLTSMLCETIHLMCQLAQSTLVWQIKYGNGGYKNNTDE